MSVPGYPMVNGWNVKDSSWLQLEVCREFQRNKCTRTDNECKFAHPQSHVEVQNGKVTACFDSLKGRCNREKPACKYYHPPQHLRDQLLVNGRNNLAVRNSLMQQFATTGALPVAPGTLQMASPTGQLYGFSPNMTQYCTPSANVGDVTMATQLSVPQQKAQRCDRLEVCREFQRGSCRRPEEECRYAHPPDHVTVDEGHVTVCMDAIKGRCCREPCRYFHPPAHIQQRIPRSSPTLRTDTAYDQPVYFGALPGAGMAYHQRPLVEKLGIHYYPSAAAGTTNYQHLMLQQQQQQQHSYLPAASFVGPPAGLPRY